jgi:cobalt-zinc-cadmium efflux system protein
MSHVHVHSESHSHAHHSHLSGREDFTTAFVVGISLNLALVVAQLIGGWIAHSLALVADAGHNFTDVLGLALAWWVRRLEKAPPSVTHTYGLRGASILAALSNAALLLVTMGALGWNAIVRLSQPPVVQAQVVMLVAAIGIVINGVSAALFLSGQRDLNLKAAFAHLAADAAISLGVLITGFAMLKTGAAWLDPVATLAIVALVVYGTWGLLRESMHLALQAVPSGVDLRAIHEDLSACPGVANVHDLHVWAMSTTETALTAHLVLRPGQSGDDVLSRVTQGLRDRFHILHTTIQVELPQTMPLSFRGRAAAPSSETARPTDGHSMKSH